MSIKIILNDLLKNKMITAILCVFVILSSLLAANGANMIVELTSSINSLFTKSQPPHFVQMHAGELNEKEIKTFTETSHLVKASQVTEMIQVDRRNIQFGEKNQLDDGGVMDHYFVVQNDSFDYLLNMKSDIVQVSKGEIAVPLYYKHKYELEIGDPIKLHFPHRQLNFTITDFV